MSWIIIAWTLLRLERPKLLCLRCRQLATLHWTLHWTSWRLYVSDITLLKKLFCLLLFFFCTLFWRQGYKVFWPQITFCFSALKTRTTEYYLWGITTSNAVTIIWLRHVTKVTIFVAFSLLLYSFLTSRFQSLLTSDDCITITLIHSNIRYNNKISNIAGGPLT